MSMLYVQLVIAGLKEIFTVFPVLKLSEAGCFLLYVMDRHLSGTDGTFFSNFPPEKGVFPKMNYFGFNLGISKQGITDKNIYTSEVFII